MAGNVACPFARALCQTGDREFTFHFYFAFVRAFGTLHLSTGPSPAVLFKKKGGTDREKKNFYETLGDLRYRFYFTMLGEYSSNF